MRLRADYDPDWNASDAMVGFSLVSVEQAIYDFDRVPEDVRRSFAIHLLFNQRSLLPATASSAGALLNAKHGCSAGSIK